MNDLNKPMNPKVKALWLDALRSGEYKQGSGRLQTSDGKFCCLGVLCDLAMKSGVIQPPKKKLAHAVHGEIVWFYGDWDYDFISVPTDVQRWAGLSDRNVLIRFSPDDGSEEIYLSDLNDSGEYTFDEIADLIEQYL